MRIGSRLPTVWGGYAKIHAWEPGSAENLPAGQIVHWPPPVPLLNQPASHLKQRDSPMLREKVLGGLLEIKKREFTEK